MIKTASIYLLLDYCIDLLDRNITFEMINGDIINTLIELDPTISKWLPIINSDLCKASPDRWKLLAISMEHQARYNTRAENDQYYIMKYTIPIITRIFNINPLYCNNKYSPVFKFSLNINDYRYFTPIEVAGCIEVEIINTIKKNGYYTNGIFIEHNKGVFNIYT
jgi:hypothetical protein